MNWMALKVCPDRLPPIVVAKVPERKDVFPVFVLAFQATLFGAPLVRFWPVKLIDKPESEKFGMLSEM